MHDALSAKAFANIVNEEGGASHNIKTSAPATGPGIMVSVADSEKITKAPLTTEQVQTFREKHATSCDGFQVVGLHRFSQCNVFFHEHLQVII